jgi:serine/threonine-protein kinase
MSERIIEFIRKKDLKFVKELGQGACGKTILLHDEMIDEYFVCKKYAPIEEEWKLLLFQNFVREIKLLHLLNHPHVVRVFNHYLYPDNYAGYIVMEYVQGADIADFLHDNPDHINEVFMQVVSGFCHLEENEILHRDIRPQNLLISETGHVKIIDFGFGKKVTSSQDFGKSVSLNWWCEPPLEFGNGLYDYKTEVYFVGKLFQKILLESDIEEFRYKSLLARMCEHAPADRIEAFSEVRRAALAAGFGEIPFRQDELGVYRRFSETLHSLISKMEKNAKYITDGDRIQRTLEETYRNTMLEEVLPQNVLLIRCFLDGAYYYRTDSNVRVSTLKEFLDLFRSCSRERRQIILSNLHTKLDSLKRYDAQEDFDDIPF